MAPRKKSTRTRGQRRLLRYGWLLPLAAIFVGGGILVLTYAFASIPLPEDIELDSSAEVYDVNGNLIGTFADEVTRFLIDTDKLLKQKPFIGEAVISAEDRDFYEHNGVSLKGILRAAWQNVAGGAVSQGGSTITQQYVKQAVLEDPSRTVTRKVKEAVLALKLERRFSKKEILGFYLNTIYFGRGAYGIEAAARAYFDKSADELNLSEMAYFAGIIPSPESYQPDEDQAAARERRDRVLETMVTEGYIDEARARSAARRKVKLSPAAVEAGLRKRQEAAYFMEWLRKNFLYPEYGDRLYAGGLKIYTTLDLEMQAQAEAAVDEVLFEKTDPQAALVSMTPRGEVRALVGGKDHTNVSKARGFNYATTFPGRQPGSSFKPFTLMAAIEEGISPQSRFSGSSPMTIEDPACEPDGTWEVDNYGGSSYGTVDLVTATRDSVNTVYAQLVAEIGPQAVADMVDDFGFNPKYGESEFEAVCSLALGGATDVTPLEMARAYAGFAGRGLLPHVNPILYIEDSDGNCIKEYVPRKGGCGQEEKSTPERVADENSVDVLNQTLTSVVEGGTAQGASIGRPVAGKTGTTQNNGNAWFAGYTPQLATVVWVGYPLDPGADGKFGTECGGKAKSEEDRLAAQSRCAADDLIPEMRYCADPNLCRPVHGIEVTGGSFPADIWREYMIEATADMPIEDFPTPVDIPDEVINSPPPAPVDPVPSGEPSAEPTDDVEPSPEPTEEPSPEPSPEPSGEPTILPSPTAGEGGRDPEDDP